MKNEFARFFAGFGVAFAWFVLVLLACFFAAGCVHTTVELPNNGGRFSRTTFLSNTGVGNVVVKTSGADAGVKIDNYGQNGTEVAKAALLLAQALTKPTP